MNQLEVLTEKEEIGEEIKEEKAETGEIVPFRSKNSEPEPRSLRATLRKAFYAFSEWCNRWDIDERGLRP
jgi:hypothetical protein